MEPWEFFFCSGREGLAGTVVKYYSEFFNEDTKERFAKDTYNLFEE